MSTVLVTGGAGFIGSHFVDLILKEELGQVIVLDKMTYAGKLSNMDSFIGNERVTFINGDISNSNDLKKIFDKYKFSLIYNFAAESHVDNSISSPSIFIDTNIKGTHNLLNISKLNWEKYPDWKEKFRFVQISTDEVYGSLGEGGAFSEDMSLEPSSPYSASKASADLLCLSYFKTYGFPVIITRSSNNFGPRQDQEKLIPKTIINALESKEIPVYGNGMNVRDWIYVKDNCRAIYILSKKGLLGNIYNIGGRNEKKNIEIIQDILLKTNKNDFNLVRFVPDRMGHDFRYSVNDDKTRLLIGNFSETPYNLALELTINFYEKNYE